MLIKSKGHLHTFGLLAITFDKNYISPLYRFSIGFRYKVQID